MEISKSEQTKIEESPQASAVYTRALKLLDLFGTDMSNKARNEGDDRKRVFAVEISDDSVAPNKLGLTSYLDNQSLMLYSEDEKGVKKIIFDGQTVLDVMTHTRDEETLDLDVNKKINGNPKQKTINQDEVLGEINMLLAKGEDAKNSADKSKNAKFAQSKALPRRGLAIARKIINTGGKIIYGIIPR
jgi:hypothetical protein